MTETLVILHTNDIHSHFEHMPKISQCIEEKRRANKDAHIVTLDIGDHLDRMAPETEGSEGKANIAVMNTVAYDAVVIGNNEGLTFEPSHIKTLYAEANFPVIGSNIHELDHQGIPDWMHSHVVLERGSMKIGLIGVTVDFNDFYHLLGWHIADPLQVVHTLVKQLRDEVDMIVVLSHLGFTKDKKMAETIEGIDVILGGHTHHLLEECMIINNTVIGAAGKFGTHVGQMEFTWNKHTKELHYVNGKSIDVSSFSNESSTVDVIERYRMSSKAVLQEKVLELSTSMSIDYQKESPLGNVLAAGIRKKTESELSIVNAGQIVKALHAGDITREMILEACPSPINPCSVWMTGRQIWECLEQSLLPKFYTYVFKGFGFRGDVLGGLCIDGMSVTYDPSHHPMEKIKRVTIGEEHIVMEKKYKVGTIDMFTFGVGYPTFRDAEVIEFFLPEFIRDILIHQLKDENEVRKSFAPRWFSM
ncbi:bifunctional metallophosphatase/5'-nucleotidase [Longirhabdus pacifica]|uniref:bifunctional metallophosphatase/5'-nucleotidase n=1 Tax=Longirhabdus pacifica TaxID=2305227 RepID=UPI001008AF42|nr:bifunctional UDP-sugar hydrolase/5'-nucleotidase [Longirhabdus pacifica]